MYCHRDHLDYSIKWKWWIYILQHPLFFISFIGYFRGSNRSEFFTQQQQFTVRDNGDTVSLNNNGFTQMKNGNRKYYWREVHYEKHLINRQEDVSIQKSDWAAEKTANDLHQKLRHLVNIDRLTRTVGWLWPTCQVEPHPGDSQIINDRRKKFLDFINALRTRRI